MVVAAGLDETLVSFKQVLGITIVAVTHELESIRAIADRAVMLGKGSVLAEGTIDELSHSRDDAVYQFFHRISDGALGASAATVREPDRRSGPPQA